MNVILLELSHYGEFPTSTSPVNAVREMVVQCLSSTHVVVFAVINGLSRHISLLQLAFCWSTGRQGACKPNNCLP